MCNTTAADTVTQGTINHAMSARIFLNTTEIGEEDIIEGSVFILTYTYKLY